MQKGISKYNNLVIETRPYPRNEKNSKKQYVIKTDGTLNYITKLPTNLGSNPEWSPDGQWIVFSKEHYAQGAYQSFQSDIYIMRADGSQLKVISSQVNSFAPSWSPDGKWVVYSYSVQYAWGSENTNRGLIITNVECLLRKEACTPSSFTLISTNNSTINPASWRTDTGTSDWHPSESKIAFVGETSEEGIKHIYTINTNGQNSPVDLTPSYEGSMHFPNWSPDGKKILSDCGEYINNHSYEHICVMNGDGSNLAKIELPAKTEDIHDIKWSPDGHKIVFVINIKNRSFIYSLLFCNMQCDWTRALFIVNTNGSDLTRIKIDDNEFLNWIAWYPKN